MKKRNKIMVILTSVVAIMAINSHLSPPSDSDIRVHVVKLVNDRGSCTGEQIHAPSGKDYILTAAHCRKLSKADGSITVITEDGKRLERKVIAEDDKSDLLLMEGLPSVRGLSIAEYSLKHEHVRTFTHGGGHDTYQTQGELMETIRAKILIGMITDEAEAAACKGAKYSIEKVETFFGDFNVCLLDVMEILSTAAIIPGSSGGPLLNDSGELVGVVSAGGDNIHLFVRLVDIKDFIKNY